MGRTLSCIHNKCGFVCVCVCAWKSWKETAISRKQFLSNQRNGCEGEQAGVQKTLNWIPDTLFLTRIESDIGITSKDLNGAFNWNVLHSLLNIYLVFKIKTLLYYICLYNNNNVQVGTKTLLQWLSSCYIKTLGNVSRNMITKLN